jgi:hypothetical protein
VANWAGEDEAGRGGNAQEEARGWAFVHPAQDAQRPHPVDD